jgi:hypothetical protein
MEAEARSKEAEDYRRKTERQIQTLEVRRSPSSLHEGDLDRELIWTLLFWQVNIRLKEELIRSLAHSEKEAEQLVRGDIPCLPSYLSTECIADVLMSPKYLSERLWFVWCRR